MNLGLIKATRKRLCAWAFFPLMAVAVSSGMELRGRFSFPPLWQVQVVEGDETWQWEGTVRAGFQQVLHDATHYLERAGWTHRHLVDVQSRPVVRLAVWEQDGAQFLLLLREKGVANWSFSAGIKQKRIGQETGAY